jgi:hypothetical protein
MAEIAGTIEQARAHGPMRDAPTEFVVAVANSLAQTTMDFMTSDPAHADEHSRAGFDALRGMLGILANSGMGESRECPGFGNRAVTPPAAKTAHKGPPRPVH